MHLVGRHVCFRFTKGMERVVSSPRWAHCVRSPDFTSELILYYLHFGADYSSRKNLFTTLFAIATSLQGTQIPILQGSKRSLVVFCTVLPQNYSKTWTQRRKITASVSLVSVWLCDNFAPCLCKNWSKTSFLLLEWPFIPLQFLIQNFIEQLFGRWMSERPEEMEGRATAQKGVVPSQLNGREPGTRNYKRTCTSICY